MRDDFECQPVSSMDSVADPRVDEDFFFQVLDAERIERENLEVETAPELSTEGHEAFRAAMLAVE